MAEDANANIRIDIDTTAATAALKALQSQIARFHTEMARGGAVAGQNASKLQQDLVNSINAGGQFQAGMTKIQSTTEAFTTALEKNKLSMGQYFRYAGASTKTFGRFFRGEFETITKVATERVKDLQTQYVSMGRDANGALRAIKVRPLTLDMNNLATQTMIAAQKQQLYNQLLKQGSTNLLNFGKNTQWAGRQLMVGFTLPLTLFASTAAKSFMEIEKQVIRIRRVYGDFSTTVAETDKMIDSIKTLAGEYTKYGVAVKDTLGLAAEAAAAGKSGQELLAQISEATRLAVLGNVEQTQALETTMSVTNAFGVATEDLANKIDFLNAVENQSVTSIEDLTVAIPKAGPVVKQLGGNVEDLAFFLTAMKEGGINASEGANALKSGLAALINPTGKAKEMLEGFGIGIEKIVNSNKGDVKGLVIDFASALDTLDPLNRARAIEQLFGKFQFSRLSTLFQNVIGEGTQASRVLELTKATTQELAILSQRELKKVEDTTTYKFEKAFADFQAALAPVGEQFLKAITPVIEFGTKLLNQFNSMGDGAKSFAVILTTVVAGIGPVLLMTVGLVANGVANLIKMFQALGSIFNKSGADTTTLGLQTEYMTQQQLEAAAVAASLNQSHTKLTQVFSVEAAALNSLTLAYQKAVTAQRGFGMPGGKVPGSAIKPKNFATGGVVRGPGSGTSDSIPAMLSNGEAVIPAKQTKKYSGFISQMIAGNVPGFFKGVMLPQKLGKTITTRKVYEAPAVEADRGYLLSSMAGKEPEKYLRQHSGSGGHSFEPFGVGGVYIKPDGTPVMLKPVQTEELARAEMFGTRIAREVHGLKAPEQKLVVMQDPTDLAGQRRFLALESAYDSTFVAPEQQSFTKNQFFKQLVASLLRNDKDLQSSNLWADVIADVGPAGVFSRASGVRSLTTDLPSMEQQAMVNLLGIKGGARKDFALATADMARTISPKDYAGGITREIDEILPKLKSTINSFDLSPEEKPVYQAMIARLEAGRNVDWTQMQAIHAAAMPTAPRAQGFALGGFVGKKPPITTANKKTTPTSKIAAEAYDFDDTLIDFGQYLKTSREANKKLPWKDRVKWWSDEELRGAINVAHPMPRVIEQLKKSQQAGKQIIVLTARPSSADGITREHLAALGIDPTNIKIVSRNRLDPEMAALKAPELKNKLATQLINDYDIEAFYDDLLENRKALSVLGIKTFDPLKMAKGGMIPGYKNGVVSVPGPKGAGDVVPAMLSPGEAVIPSAMAKKYGGLINGMIAGNIPGYETGVNAPETWDLSDLPGRRRASIQGSFDSLIAKGYQKQVQEVIDSLDGLEVSTRQAQQIFSNMNTAAKGGTEQLTSWVATLKENRAIVSNTGELIRTQKLTTGVASGGALTNFTHIGAGRDIPAQQIIDEYGTEGLSQSEIEKLTAAAQQNENVAVKSMLAMDDFSADVNRKLATTGATIQEFSDAFDVAGVEKWHTSVIAGGGNIENLSADILAFDNRFKQLIAGVGKSTVIFDTMAQAQAHMAANAGAAATSLEQLYATARAAATQGLGQVLDTAHTTPGELRYGSSRTGNKKYPVNFNRILADRAAIESQNFSTQLARFAQTASPSRLTETVAKDTVNGYVKGLQSGANEVQKTGRTTGRRVTKATGGPIVVHETGTQIIPTATRKPRRAQRAADPTVYEIQAKKAARDQMIRDRVQAAFGKKEQRKAFGLKTPMQKVGGTIAAGVKNFAGGPGMMAASMAGMTLMMVPGFEALGIALGTVVPMLMMMPLAVGGAIAALGLLAFGVYKLIESQEQQRQKAIELGNAQSMSQTALEKMSEDFGTVSVTQARKSEQDAKLLKTTEEQLTAGQQYITEMESGQKLLAGVKAQQAAGVSTSEISQNVASNLANAVAQKVITKEQGSAIIAALGSATGNFGISSSAGSQFELYTRDLTKTAAMISSESLRNQSQAFASASKRSSSFEAMGFGTGFSQDTLLPLLGVDTGISTMRSSSTATANLYGQAVGGIDTINAAYDAKVEEAKTQKQINELERLRTIDVEKQKQIAADTYKEIEKQKEALSATDFNNNFIENIKANFAEDSPTRKTADAINALSDTTDGDFKLRLQTQLQSGSLSAESIDVLLEYGKNNKDFGRRYNLAIATQGEQATLDLISYAQAAGGTEQTINLLINAYSTMDPETARLIGLGVKTVALVGVDVNGLSNSKLEEIGLLAEKIGDKKEVTLDFIRSEAGNKVYNDWKNVLDNKKMTASLFIRITAIGDLGILQQYLKAKGIVTKSGALFTTADALNESGRAKRLDAQSKRWAIQQDRITNPGGDITPPAAPPTGGGGGSTASTEDPVMARLQARLAKQNALLNIISLKEAKINKRFDERKKVLEEISKLNGKIAEQQRGQLDVADALTRGDIAAAARAVQAERVRAAALAHEQQMLSLERQRQAELANVTVKGKTRADVEAKIDKLNMKIAKREYRFASSGGIMKGYASGGRVRMAHLSKKGKSFDIYGQTFASSGGMMKGYSVGGKVMSYFADGGSPLGSDTIPAMLTPGEFVIKRPAVQNFGVKNLEAINSGSNPSSGVYNYSISVNVSTEANPDQIARAVAQNVRRTESYRIRGNKL